MEQTEVAGVLWRDERGDIVGVAGLSVVASRHELWMVGRQFWTWCAKDALGILAALKSDCRVISQSPETGAELTVDIEAGNPAASRLALFMAASNECCSVYDDRCPTVNLFEDREIARSWATKQAIEGSEMSIDGASALGAQAWGPLVPGSGL